jgi:RNA polymerase sigma-70 factor (ECF subfamily)
VAVTWSPDEDAAPLAADDRELVERASGGDSVAVAVLYRRYVDRIYRFAFRRMGTHHRAEEVTAATFERALRALPHFVWRGAGFEPWLFRIASNECAAWFRREQRTSRPRARLALVTYAGDELVVDAGTDLDGGDDVVRIRRALATLTPRYQHVIALRYFADLSTEEAAAAMGCSKAVLSVTLHRAVAALQRVLERDEAEVER